MSSFIGEAIARAGLEGVIPARARGDLDAARGLVTSKDDVDLLVIGALADRVRMLESGDVVRIHPAPCDSVIWITDAATELDLLRAIATARVTGPLGARIGVDWGKHGLELAQVAIGFGATDLVGPITRKNGLLIREDEKKKVKGLGMVESSALKRREIAALVRNAGREPVFTDEESPSVRRQEVEAAHV